MSLPSQAPPCQMALDFSPGGSSQRSFQVLRSPGSGTQHGPILDHPTLKTSASPTSLEGKGAHKRGGRCKGARPTSGRDHDSHGHGCRREAPSPWWPLPAPFCHLILGPSLWCSCSPHASPPQNGNVLPHFPCTAGKSWFLPDNGMHTEERTGSPAHPGTQAPGLGSLWQGLV